MSERVGGVGRLCWLGVFTKGRGQSDAFLLLLCSALGCAHDEGDFCFALAHFPLCFATT